MSDRDDALAIAVNNSLAHNLSLPAGRVEFDVRDGWITLTGVLDWEFQREAAEAGLRDIPGVVGLINATTIRPDAEIED